MAGDKGMRRAASSDHGRAARARQWWQRAWGSAGYERHTVLLIGKSTLAATVAWVIAHHFLHAQSPAFAPFSAVLIMQVTVYQSVAQALRYVTAVAAGVLMQAALAFVGGPDVLTFALVALIGLVIGRWSALGSQGPQVATAAFFAFSAFTAADTQLDKAVQLGQIVLLVLVGCAVAIAVNLTVVPPMRYRSAEYAIHALAHAMCDVISDMHPALKAGRLDEESTGQWRTRAEQTGGLIAQAKADFRTAEESPYYNPRRLFRQHRTHASFHGYAAVLAALERTLYQVASLTRSLDQWRVEEGHYRYVPFLQCYGEFLLSIAEIAGLLGALDEDDLGRQTHELRQLAEKAQHCRRQVTEQAEQQALPLTDPTRPYGVLVIEATRLMEEFQHTCDVLEDHAHR